MAKQPVTKFDLEAAFKALDELEVPVAGKGLRPNRVNLKETLVKKQKTDALIEDYYDVNDKKELQQAQEEREDEIAKAKLTRIEKIIDLDAKSPEDLQPSYVGKTIVQCPQCMTLFYKSPEDIEPSEDDENIVNIGETCQHCGNESGYTLVGKVGEAEPVEGAEEDDLNLDFGEPTEETLADFPTEEEPEAEEIENADKDLPANDDDEEIDLDLTDEEEKEDEEDTEFAGEEEADEEYEEEKEKKIKQESTEVEKTNAVLTEAKGDKYILYGMDSLTNIFTTRRYYDTTGRVKDIKAACQALMDEDERITVVNVDQIKDGKLIPIDKLTLGRPGHDYDNVLYQDGDDIVEESFQKFDKNGNAVNSAGQEPIEFEPKISLDDVDEIDEELLNTHITESLVKTYSNVKSFKTTECVLNNKTLIIEGIISFKSNKTLKTKYQFTNSISTRAGLTLIGLNEGLNKNGKFRLRCTVDSKNKKLIPEGFLYRENIAIKRRAPK